MILTDEFVVLNYPRTGSTFVREALRALYQPRGRLWSKVLSRFGRGARFQELLLPIDRTLPALREGRHSQHGRYAQIPASHRGKPVVSVTRNPLDRIVSQYEHGFWRDHPIADPAALRRLHPSFPDLSFPEFLQMQATFGLPAVLQDVPLQAEVGPMTVHFVRFYYENPEAILAHMDDVAVESGEILHSMPPIRFLHTEKLAEELCAFLHEIGFTPEETQFMLDMRPVNAAASRARRPWTDYFTPKMAEEFRHLERLVFKRFPEYDD